MHLCLKKFDVNRRNSENLLGKCTSKNLATLHHSKTDFRMKRLNARQSDPTKLFVSVWSKHEFFAAHSLGKCALDNAHILTLFCRNGSS